MTARWNTREELGHQIAVLAAQGLSRRAISRALGASRNTIRTRDVNLGKGRIAVSSRR